MLFKNYSNLISNGSTPTLQQKRKDILAMLAAAVDAVHPSHIVKDLFRGPRLVFPSETIDLSSFDHLYLVGFGKASAGMAQAVCDAVAVTKGVIITNDSTATITHKQIVTIIGGHPLPTEESLQGTEKILSLLRKCNQNDCVVVVISGGGSSLFCKPRVPLSDLQHTMNLLLRSGATIDEVNTIRKHLSLVKGGRLVEQTKAVVISLIISDVIHDPISSIASGPTSPDPTSFSDAKEILQRYDLWEKISTTVRSVIQNGIQGRIPETLKENSPAFTRVFNFIVGNNSHACEAALKKAQALGYNATVVTTSITGEAKVVGRSLIQKIKNDYPEKNCVFITGGETTVMVQGDGIGGRNQELVLSCIEEIAGTDIVLASFATDGIDGNSDAAGALADGSTYARTIEKNLNYSHFLEMNNSYVFFRTLGDVLSTGFTGTNVMDIQIVIR